MDTSNGYPFFLFSCSTVQTSDKKKLKTALRTQNSVLHE